MNMSISSVAPPMGLNESCMPFTEPLEVWVVKLPQSAVAVAPKRTSLPSRLGPSAARPAKAALGWFSDQMFRPDERHRHGHHHAQNRRTPGAAGQ